MSEDQITKLDKFFSAEKEALNANPGFYEISGLAYTPSRRRKDRSKGGQMEDYFELEKRAVYSIKLEKS